MWPVRGVIKFMFICSSESKLSAFVPFKYSDARHCFVENNPICISHLWGKDQKRFTKNMKVSKQQLSDIYTVYLYICLIFIAAIA